MAVLGAPAARRPCLCSRRGAGWRMAWATRTAATNPRAPTARAHTHTERESRTHARTHKHKHKIHKNTHKHLEHIQHKQARVHSGQRRDERLQQRRPLSLLREAAREHRGNASRSSVRRGLHRRAPTMIIVAPRCGHGRGSVQPWRELVGFEGKGRETSCVSELPRLGPA